MTRHLLLVFALVLAAACGGRPAANIGTLAPNPNECYLMVFDEPAFRGTGDVFNRPGRWANLKELSDTREHNWSNRIRSVRTGSAATATVFTNPDFKGQSLQVSPGRAYSQLEAEFAAEVESLTIACK